MLPVLKRVQLVPKKWSESDDATTSDPRLRSDAETNLEAVESVPCPVVERLIGGEGRWSCVGLVDVTASAHADLGNDTAITFWVPVVQSP
jgi:hypothetical protein